MKKNLFSVWWLVLFFFIFEVLFYIVEPFISNIAILILSILMLLLVISFLLLYVFSQKIKKEYIIHLILVLGFILRMIYILKTNINVRQHDVGNFKNYGHLHYIYYLYMNGRLPDCNWGQFYHPPLFHIIATIFLKINDFFGVMLDRSVEGIQYVTVFASSVTMIFTYKIIDKLNLDFIKKAILNLFFAFFPTFIFLSGSINNDCFLLMFQIITIYLLILWYNDDSYFNTVLLALSVGFAVMTKLNGALLALPISFVFICRFIKVFRSDRKELIKLIKKFILFGIISLPIGLWFQIRELILYKDISVPPPSDWLYTGKYGFIKRFILIDVTNLKNIYVLLPGEYSIINFIFKSSLFGEWTFLVPKIISILMLFINILLIFISLYFIIKYIIRYKNYNMIYNILIINFFVNIISYIIFNINYPYLCTMDYRYIASTVLTGGIMMFSSNNKIFNLIICTITVLFSILCLLFIFAI